MLRSGCSSPEFVLNKENIVVDVRPRPVIRMGSEQSLFHPDLASRVKSTTDCSCSYSFKVFSDIIFSVRGFNHAFCTRAGMT